MLTNDEWERCGGLRCPSCGEEAVRLIDGICPQCSAKAEAERAEKVGERAERRYYKDQLRKGTISLGQMREGRLGS